MQICCATNTSRVTRFVPIRGTRNYDCQCNEWTGNCWKGSQCDGCSGNGEANGVKLCCANCQKKGLNINLATMTCNC
ncbi:hypothetical protein SNE40_013761 [Patella caerulea]|uniref:Uncharacterized protein n=1 Tax=Patella caerulea TaxID=87958 RepID=A0AAN8JGJ7_PATCE